MTTEKRPPGRPPAAEGKWERISVRIPPRLARRVRAAASAKGGGLGAWMRAAAEHYLEAKGRGDILPPELRERVREAARNGETTEAELVAAAVAAAYPPPPPRGRWGLRMAGDQFVRGWIPEE